MGKNVDFLVAEIRSIILNRPLPKAEPDGVPEEFLELQEAILYLSECLAESNGFLRSLCDGTLDANPPGKNNFLAGNLKELHAVLKHLTWQTTQVANGDYKQRVRFLGEFSDSFNLMVRQLQEREIKLHEKSTALSQSMNLLISIMDTQKDWIVVTEAATGKVIYGNQSAQKNFYNHESDQTFCGQECPMLDRLREPGFNQGQRQFEYYCERNLRFFSAASYPIEWEGESAYVHYISDITLEKASKDHLSRMAYLDDLTGIYNRRYCFENIQELLDGQEKFTLVLIDLDGLKYVNDTFGHVCGDEYICTVVGVIQKHTRDSDTLCRIGGDEFTLLLRDCTEELAVHKMEKIRGEILGVQRQYPLSISYGAAYISEKYGLEPENIIRISDAKMYAFKKKNKQERL